MRQPTKKNLLEQLSAAAFADLGRICTVETDGDMQAIHIKDTSELTKPERLALCQIKAGTRGIEVKLYDKLKAIEMIARLTGLFEPGDENEELRRLFDELAERDTDRD
ncbi:MAG: terminase small subunit [Oscillospiraceae bacterium]|nr:terminase small subunit [Oscillospiraceae bacterium]